MQAVPTLHPGLSGGNRRNYPGEISRAPDRAMETLSSISQWHGKDTEDLCFYLKMGFGSVFTFHLKQGYKNIQCVVANSPLGL